jgi:hypothetical protein
MMYAISFVRLQKICTYSERFEGGGEGCFYSSDEKQCYNRRGQMPKECKEKLCPVLKNWTTKLVGKRTSKIK